MRLIIHILTLSLSFAITSCFANSVNFRLINNFNFPLILSIQPFAATVTNSCTNDLQNIVVNARSASCPVQFNDSPTKAGQGIITIAKLSDPQSYCRYNYSFTGTTVNYFSNASIEFEFSDCHGSMYSGYFSVVNDRTQSYARPLYFQNPFNNGNTNVISPLLAKILGSINYVQSALEVPESLSLSDCAGADNCIRAAPESNTIYLTNGSSLVEEIQLQNALDRFEPLNAAQFIGTHNSAVSKQYTKNNTLVDMSYADPNNYLTITEQLNLGLRNFELDILWYRDAIAICHNSVSQSLEPLLCNGNTKFATVIAEIKSWLEQHRDALLLIYLDVNQALKDRVPELDGDLALLEPYIFTPAMAEHYFQVGNNSLPAAQLTKDDLVSKFSKNVIVFNDDDIDNLQTSKYVFVHVDHSKATPLYHIGVDDFLHSQCATCHGAAKYTNITHLFPEDPQHYNLFRLNDDRTVISYVHSAHGKSPSHESNYLASQNIKEILRAPFNIFAQDMFGYTCNDSHCTTHPTPARLSSFLWSWEIGYPLKIGGSNIVYLDRTTEHFKNDSLPPAQSYAVLCIHPSDQATPVAPLAWYLAKITTNNLAEIFPQAQNACQQSHGIFAVPTTSYAMSDVLDMVNALPNAPDKVIVNYLYDGTKWNPNADEHAACRSLYLH